MKLPAFVNKQSLGLVVLIGAIFWSVLQSFTAQRQLDENGVAVIRIAHWQLEAGYRQALQATIEEYEKLHDHKVKVIQLPITEKVYPQWVNTNFLSGTAPDLTEIGLPDTKISDDTYTLRYLLPLGEIIYEPNPYNKGTELERMPWKETFIDGMRGGYSDNLKEYYKAPTTFWAFRFFYNKDLLLKATGSEAYPKTLGGVLEASKKVREYGIRTNQQLFGVTSCYKLDFLKSRLKIPFTAGYEEKLDWDYSGWISSQKTYAGFMRGQISPTDPQIVAYYNTLKRVADEMPVGFINFDRQQAQFLFVQGQSAFLMTGSWDAEGLAEQAKFRFGVGSVPYPGPGEPDSQYVIGRGNESADYANAAFGIYKYSKHPDLAVDFLRFLTSRKYNELFNQKANWPPVIIGAKPTELMRPFLPDPVGYYASTDFGYGAETADMITGREGQFLAGEIPYDTLAKVTVDALNNPIYGGDRQWSNDYYGAIGSARNEDRLIEINAVLNLVHPDPIIKEKYQKGLSNEIRNNNGAAIRYRFEQIRKLPILPQQ